MRIIARQRLPSKPAQAVVRLRRSAGPAQGTVVLSYLTDSFTVDAAAHFHSNRWECRAMARAFQDAGFEVDVINHDDRVYAPPADCAAIVDLHANLDRLAALAPPSARRIFHATGAHWEFQNRAEHARLAALLARRGVSLPPRRQVPPSRAIETAQFATTTGNAFTIGTFAFAGKSMRRVPISSVFVQDWNGARNFAECGRRFLWLGSFGFVHKGLDLVLEAFAHTPGLHLTVAGALDLEPDFMQAFSRELSLPNVQVAGWVDTKSEAFRQLLATHGAIVYPSCSEGGGGSVITCLHGGLIPIVTREASVDVGDFGCELCGAEVAEIISALEDIAALPAAELAARCRAGWEFARAQHTREAFERNYRALMGEMIGRPLVS